MLLFTDEFTFTIGNGRFTFTVPCFDYKGIKVVKIDELEEKGFHFTNGGDISIGKIDGDEPVIFIFDKIFSKTQTEKSCEFFLEHEIGHYKCGHLDQDPEKMARNQKRRINGQEVIPEELEADQYAASILGVDYCIKAIRENIEFLKSCFPHLKNSSNPIRELIKRMKVLENST